MSPRQGGLVTQALPMCHNSPRTNPHVLRHSKTRFSEAVWVGLELLLLRIIIDPADFAEFVCHPTA